jgi:hypothetical protein
MQLSSEQIEMIKRVAGAGYSPRETAFVLGISPAEFIKAIENEESEASIAYYNGFFSNELKVRESIMQMARSASSPAQTQALKILDATRQELTKGDFPGFNHN